MPRTWIERALLTVILPAVAGTVNACGFLEFGSYTSHVTGHVARSGAELAQRNIAVAWREAALVVFFWVGAVISTWLIELAKRRDHSRYVVSLVLQALVMGGYAVLAMRTRDTAYIGLPILLCFAMGTQNALVTKISGARVRTTHVTGIVTDLGIECAQWVLHLWLKVSGAPRHHHQPADVRKLRLLGVILFSFFGGAVGGPMLFLKYGQIAMLMPCTLLLLLAAFDHARGIKDLN